MSSSSSLSQAYLCTQPGMTIRVRVVDDRTAYLTIKGKQAGIGRPEYEYEIPVDDAHGAAGHGAGRLPDQSRPGTSWATRGRAGWWMSSPARTRR